MVNHGKPNDKPSTWPWDYHVETSCWTIPEWKLGARDQGRTWGWTTTIPVPSGRGCRGCSGETDAGFQQKCGKYGDGSKWSKAIVHPANHPSTLFAKSNVDSLIILIYSVNSTNSIAFFGKYLDKNLTHLAGMPWMPWMWPWCDPPAGTSAVPHLFGHHHWHGGVILPTQADQPDHPPAFWWTIKHQHMILMGGWLLRYRHFLLVLSREWMGLLNGFKHDFFMTFHKLGIVIPTD